MADARIIRSKTQVRINLWPVDIADILTQPEVLSNFNGEELSRIKEAVDAECTTRGAS